MIFLPIPQTAKAALTKVITDSTLDFKLWPAEAESPVWLQFNGNSLDQLFIWLTPRCAEKVEFVDQLTENARKLFKKITSEDYTTYQEVFDIFRPFLLKNTNTLSPNFHQA